ncbi:MAG: LuxR C-terminal-related transcriptional regulator [Rhodocyclaceae bacterium]|nr:LuxR C-terminal-related transcriptional regulator [Rhodocyclaceae bacterium]
MVFVIDDDPDVCTALAWLIGSIKLEVRTFSCITDFLAASPSGNAVSDGCLVLDVRMPGMGGMELLKHMRARREIGARLENLSQRERKVARLVAAGRHNKEIARALGLSARTVEGHRAHALHKLGVASAAELASFLMRPPE